MQINSINSIFIDHLHFQLSRVAFDESGRPVGAAVNNVCNQNEVRLELVKELKEVEDPQYVILILDCSLIPILYPDL